MYSISSRLKRYFLQFFCIFSIFFSKDPGETPKSLQEFSKCGRSRVAAAARQCTPIEHPPGAAPPDSPAADRLRRRRSPAAARHILQTPEKSDPQKYSAPFAGGAESHTESPAPGPSPQPPAAGERPPPAPSSQQPAQKAGRRFGLLIDQGADIAVHRHLPPVQG